MGLSNERFLTLVLLGLGVYFSVLLVRGIAGYLRFRRLRDTALLTWPAPPPSHFAALMGLGGVALALAVVAAWMHRPFHHVYAQAAMAAYFMGLVPLCRRIRLGLYEGGVWADAGFLPWERIRRMAFRETPEIVLVLLARQGHPSSYRLPVPPAEYGAVRKVIEEKIRARVLTVDAGILGL